MSKENKVIISVIIPIYNAEKHLKECLESIINQTFKDFEIILIDDGSIDNSSHIYAYYQNKDSRIRVIKQKNQGVSIARNNGINHAKGEFLLFVDADDRIKQDMLLMMYNAIVKNNSEIAFCGFEVVGTNLRKNDTHVLKKCKKNKSTSIITAKEAIERTISTNPNEMLYGYIWRNLYSSKIIKGNNIKFYEGIKISEDFMFIIEVLKKCNNVSIISEELYIYNVNDSSVTTKYIDTLHNDMNFINNWILENICNKFPDVLEGYYCCVANTYLGSIQNICRRGTPYSLVQRIKYAYELKNSFNYIKVIKTIWYKKEYFRKKAWMAMILFRLKLDFIYIILFSLKEKKI